MMKYALLGSGSKGNCFLLEDEGTVIQIDCGTTKKYLLECFRTLHHEITHTDALLITHDHGDHVSQLRTFKDLDIYAPVELPDVEQFFVHPLKSFVINNLKITPLALSHDALNTTGYVIEDGIEKLTYITDTGYVSEKYFDLIRGSDYIVMESNHDVEMLMQTRRPQYLKARIYGDEGHLNNEDCASVLINVITENTKEVILAHISAEANTREKALETTVQALRDSNIKLNPALRISAAGQYEMIWKGGNDEEGIDCSICCSIGMEHHPNGSRI